MPRVTALVHLRRLAASQLIVRQGSLAGAIERLAFVQADPIRCPAAAQDLILRHRVEGYRAGDLERDYASLDIEEDTLYAYGFMPRRVRQLLHPRRTRALSVLEKKVLEAVRAQGPTHPGTLEALFGRRRVKNAWGGVSRATTRALDDLHHRGLLRVARRESGVRVYEPAIPAGETVSERQRLRALILVTATILAPVPLRTLRRNVARYRHLGDPRAEVADLLRSGELASESVGGIAYAWPASAVDSGAAPRTVRFLAPFDPVVWDRDRFEHLWGWRYRFEAYTPVARRVRGYYAMPLLWGDVVVGWVNAHMSADRLEVAVGFVRRRPLDASFRSSFEEEVARMEAFLRP